MTDLNLDFGGDVKASEGGFPLLPEGTYAARIAETPEVRETKPKDGEPQTASDGTQATYLNPTYEIIEDDDFNNQKIWGMNSMRFPKNALDDTKKERQTREIFLGWLNTVTGTDFAGTNQALDLKNLVGSKVRLVVTHGSWEGKPKAEIKRILPYESENGDVEAVRRTL